MDLTMSLLENWRHRDEPVPSYSSHSKIQKTTERVSGANASSAHRSNLTMDVQSPRHHTLAIDMRREGNAMNSMSNDVASLLMLVEKLTKQYATPSDSHANNEPSSSETDQETLVRHSERLVQTVREYAAIIHAMPSSDGKIGPNEPEDSPPLSPTSNVLVGVLKRENASLIAKIRRLENETKRHDDKSMWNDEHVVRRFKALETQCAEAVAEKTRLEVLYTAAMADKDTLMEQHEQVVAEKIRLEALVADKARLEVHVQEATTEKTRLEELYIEVLAERCHFAALHAEINTEKNRLDVLNREILVEKNQLETQLESAVAEKHQMETQHAESLADKVRLEALCGQLNAEKSRLDTQLSDVITKMANLETQLSEARADKHSFETLYAEVVNEKNKLGDECNTERARSGEMETTIAQLKSRLADVEKALLNTKTNSMSTVKAISRGRRSGTVVETSGTDTDDSDSAMVLSLSDLRIEAEKSPQRDVSSPVKDGAPRVGSSPRRRAGVRGRSIIGSMIEHNPSASVDSSQSCSRSRCQSTDGSKKNRSFTPRTERVNLQLQTPRSVTSRDLSNSFCRSVDTRSSQQSNQERPRWRL